LRVLDLGCGEGKNAKAFARQGASVVAVDLSHFALANARRRDPRNDIVWVRSDIEVYLRRCRTFDVVIMYGLLHCLGSLRRIRRVVNLAVDRTWGGGTDLVVAFNRGPHLLTAHPGFVPTLAPHKDIKNLYAQHRLVFEQRQVIYETHPHNNIPHYHSISR